MRNFNSLNWKNRKWKCYKEKLSLSVSFPRPLAQDAMKATLVKSSTNHTELHRSLTSSTSCILWCRKPHCKCFKKLLSRCRLPQSKQGAFNLEWGKRSTSISRVSMAAVGSHLGRCFGCSAVKSSPCVNCTRLTPLSILPKTDPPSACSPPFQVSVPNGQENIKVRRWWGGVTTVSSPNPKHLEISLILASLHGRDLASCVSCMIKKQPSLSFFPLLKYWNALSKERLQDQVHWVSAAASTAQQSRQQTRNQFQTGRKALVCFWTPNTHSVASTHTRQDLHTSLHNDDSEFILFIFFYQILHLPSKSFTLFKIIYMTEISEGWGGGLQMYSKHLIASKKQDHR